MRDTCPHRGGTNPRGTRSTDDSHERRGEDEHGVRCEHQSSMLRRSPCPSFGQCVDRRSARAQRRGQARGVRCEHQPCMLRRSPRSNFGQRIDRRSARAQRRGQARRSLRAPVVPAVQACLSEFRTVCFAAGKDGRASESPGWSGRPGRQRRRALHGGGSDGDSVQLVEGDGWADGGRARSWRQRPVGSRAYHGSDGATLVESGDGGRAVRVATGASSLVRTMGRCVSRALAPRRSLRCRAGRRCGARFAPRTTPLWSYRLAMDLASRGTRRTRR